MTVTKLTQLNAPHTFYLTMSAPAIDTAPALAQDGVDLSNIETRIGQILRYGRYTFFQKSFSLVHKKNYMLNKGCFKLATSYKLSYKLGLVRSPPMLCGNG